MTSDFGVIAAAHPGMSSLYQLVGQWIFSVFLTSAIAATLLALIQSIVLNPTLENAESRIQQLQGQVDLVATNLRAVFDSQMFQISNRLNVRQHDDVRVSVYAHDGSGHFLLFGRYSPNPDHQKTGRPAYPDSEGCIGKGWHHSWWYEPDMGSTARKYNKKSIDEYGLSRETIDSIKMRSRFFAAQRIDNGVNSIAVIVVESLTNARFREVEVKSVLEEAALSVSSLIAAFRSYVPDPRRALDKGF